jgi:hypothetical protein
LREHGEITRQPIKSEKLYENHALKNPHALFDTMNFDQNIPLSSVLLVALIAKVATFSVNAQTDAGTDSTAADEKAQEADLVKKTLNPVASLVSVPIQNNWDFGIGPADTIIRRRLRQKLEFVSEETGRSDSFRMNLFVLTVARIQRVGLVWLLILLNH